MRVAGELLDQSFAHALKDIVALLPASEVRDLMQAVLDITHGDDQLLLIELRIALLCQRHQRVGAFAEAEALCASRCSA